MNKEQKKKIVKAIILSILLFVALPIWCYIIEATNFFNLNDPYRNVFLDFIVIGLPLIIIPLIFVREKDFHDSLVFGAAIGFVGGTLFFIYGMVASTPDPSADESLAGLVWVIFTMLFTGLSVVGSSLSYSIRKSIGKIINKKKETN